MSALAPLQKLNYAQPLRPSEKIGAKGEFAWIPLAHLRIDPSYQRDILDNGKTNIRRIVDGFQWKKFGVLEVGRRALNCYAIIDGQHRAIAAMMHGGIEKVPCMIHPGGIAEEADAFSAINAKVTRISPLQSFHADVAAGDEQAIALVALCAEAGVRITRRPKVDFHPGETMALALLRREAIKDKASLLAALKLLRALDPGAGIGADALRGTVAALKSMPTKPDDPARVGAEIGARLTKFGGGVCQLLAEASARRATRGGTPWDSFKAVLLTYVNVSQRSANVPMNRLMAGR